METPPEYEWTERRLDIEPARLRKQAEALYPLEYDVLRECGLFSATRILDFGCGDGSWLAQVQKQILRTSACMGVDRSEEILKMAQANCPDATFVYLRDPTTFTNTMRKFNPSAIVMRFVHQHLTAERSNQLLKIISTEMKEGIAICIDVDDRSFGWIPYCKALTILQAKKGQRQSEAGGNRYVGAELALRMNENGGRNVRSHWITVSSQQIGLAQWWSIVRPVFYTGVESEDIYLMLEADNWFEKAESAEFRICICTANI